MNLQKAATDLTYFAANLRIPSAKGDSRFDQVWADYQREYFDQIGPSLLAVERGEQPPCNQYWDERTKGGSKDTDNSVVLLHALAFSKRPLDMQVGAADRDQAGEVRKAIRDILRLNPQIAQRVEVQAWSVVCKATKCECTILATDVASAHGARPDILFLNELSHISQEEFAANLFDNATKKPRGLRIVATNSGFRGTWQERWRNTARDGHGTRWFYHTLSEPAPWLSQEELEEAERRNSKARFLRLFWGVWVAQLGDALDEEDIKAAITDKPMPKTRHTFYVAGLDLGIRHDHSALVVLQGDRSTQQLALAFAKNWSPNPSTGKVDLMQVEQAVYSAFQRYGLAKVGYDPYQAELLSQRLALRKVPMHEMTFVGANLNLMANTLLDVFRSRRIQLYDHPRLIADLNRLQIEEKSYGYRLSATRNEDGHADLATALAIALPLAVEAAGKTPIVAGPLDEDYSKTPFERELSRLEKKQATAHELAGYGTCESGGRENMFRAMNDLMRNDPLFQQFHRR